LNLLSVYRLYLHIRRDCTGVGVFVAICCSFKEVALGRLFAFCRVVVLGRTACSCREVGWLVLT
jgi:hypothetical protein